ncbi:helix-turn-helix domain-containing protein [Streptomyces sp. NPDC001178]
MTALGSRHVSVGGRAQARRSTTDRAGHARGPGGRSRAWRADRAAAGHDGGADPARPRAARAAENTITSIAKLLGVSRTTLYKYVPELAAGRNSLVPGDAPAPLPSPR